MFIIYDSTHWLDVPYQLLTNRYILCELHSIGNKRAAKALPLAYWCDVEPPGNSVNCEKLQISGCD